MWNFLSRMKENPAILGVNVNGAAGTCHLRSKQSAAAIGISDLGQKTDVTLSIVVCALTPSGLGAMSEAVTNLRAGDLLLCPCQFRTNGDDVWSQIKVIDSFDVGFCLWTVG